MIFDVRADVYSSFIGRFSEPLAAEFAALLNVRRGQRALDWSSTSWPSRKPASRRWPG
jgi:hypothetical protein